MTFDVKARAKEICKDLLDQYDVESHLQAYGEQDIEQAINEAYQAGRREAFEEAADVVKKTASWYPSDVFIEPPPGKHGKTVDACSARSARHILKIISEDLTRAKECGEK